MYMEVRYMYTITTTELKNNFGKYIELGQKEVIRVMKRGQVIFSIVPEKEALLAEAKSFFNMLPADAAIGSDPDERG